jgi:NAD(P)-dependent dehydrogenase (short-subunit alcohol dehydrogenase family)
MKSTSTLAGKRALVTGGSRGIGGAIARRLASQGATVAVNYRSDRAAADALVGELLPLFSLICYLSDLHVQNSWVGAAVLRACR